MEVACKCELIASFNTIRQGLNSFVTIFFNSGITPICSVVRNESVPLLGSLSMLRIPPGSSLPVPDFGVRMLRRCCTSSQQPAMIGEAPEVTPKKETLFALSFRLTTQ